MRQRRVGRGLATPEGQPSTSLAEQEGLQNRGTEGERSRAGAGWVNRAKAVP